MVKKLKFYNNFKVSNSHKQSILLIGNFDGLHLGHQKLFNLAKKYKKEKKVKLGVITFDPIPKMFFNRELKNYKISSLNQKINYFLKYNVDFVINQKFNKKFSKIDASKFIKDILYKKINPKLLAVSNNFKFGKARKGDVTLLNKFENMYSYRLLNIKPFKYLKKTVSSTKIRTHLKNGNIYLANKLLSRTWFIDGQVQKGKKIGRKLGYHTCNIKVKNYILPKMGIYAVKISIDDKKKIMAVLLI